MPTPMPDEHGGDRGVEDALGGEEAPVDGVVDEGPAEQEARRGQEQRPAGSRLPVRYVRGMSPPQGSTVANPGGEGESGQAEGGHSAAHVMPAGSRDR